MFYANGHIIRNGLLPGIEKNGMCVESVNNGSVAAFINLLKFNDVLGLCFSKQNLYGSLQVIRMNKLLPRRAKYFILWNVN